MDGERLLVRALIYSNDIRVIGRFKTLWLQLKNIVIPESQIEMCKLDIHLVLMLP